MSHTHMNESCHTHIWMSHATHMNESCHTHIWISHVTHMNESCHTHIFQAISTHGGVQHSAAICVYVTRICKSHRYMWHYVTNYWVTNYMYIRVSYILVTLVSHTHICHSYIPVSWLIHMRDMTHIYLWHDSFICVTWLIYTCDMTYSYAWHDSSIRVPWLPAHTGEHHCTASWSAVRAHGQRLLHQVHATHIVRDSYSSWLV